MAVRRRRVEVVLMIRPAACRRFNSNITGRAALLVEEGSRFERAHRHEAVRRLLGVGRALASEASISSMSCA